MFQFEKQFQRLQVMSTPGRAQYVFAEVDKRVVKVPITPTLGVSSGATVPSAVAAYVAMTEVSNGPVTQTRLALTAVPVTMRDTEQGGGVQILDFPLGRILRLGAKGTIAVTTTSVILDTLNGGKTCNWGVGSTTQASATLATTEQDIINVTAFTSSATINVAGAASSGIGIGVVTPLDGSATAIDAFLNLAVAGATDIDADATVTATGTVDITWIKL